MYTSYYNLDEYPFQITPDSRFFFGQGPHKKALAYASYGLNKAEGFVVITGEIGAGKTTLVNYLLSRLQSQERETAVLVSTKLGSDSLLRSVATAFGIEAESDGKAGLLHKIEHTLLENRSTSACSLLIVDEVQNLSHSALEELRMLSNFQHGHKVLLQTFLVGQPEFREKLLRPEAEQLRQRVVASFHLGALDEQQTMDYIEHRLRTVGWKDDPLFHPLAHREIYRATAGIPRRINLMCDRLMVSAFLAEKHDIELSDVNDVVQEMRQERLMPDATPGPKLVHDHASHSLVTTNRSPEPVREDPPRNDISDLAVQLRQLDLNMRAQERRIDQILADGLFAVSKK